MQFKNPSPVPHAVAIEGNGVDVKGETVAGKNAQPPAGFVKLPQDLNDGAGGDYIYLCYQPVAYADEVALKGVTVIGGDNADVPAPYGFQMVPGDLNDGAGGDYIYVCTSLGD